MNTNSANVIPMPRRPESALVSARVLSVLADEITIEAMEGPAAARRAFSCLVRPMPGDLALCGRDETGRYFVMGIIDRPGAQDMTLDFPAGANMVSAEGPIGLYSGESVTLASEDRLTMISGRAIHKSREAVVDYDELTARGKTLNAMFDSVSLVARLVTTMARQALERYRSYIRKTESYDQVNAGQMTREVEGLYSMDSKHTVMVSKKETKIDGERIFMG